MQSGHNAPPPFYTAGAGGCPLQSSHERSCRRMPRSSCPSTQWPRRHGAHAIAAITGAPRACGRQRKHRAVAVVRGSSPVNAQPCRSVGALRTPAALSSIPRSRAPARSPSICRHRLDHWSWSVHGSAPRCTCTPRSTRKRMVPW